MDLITFHSGSIANADTFLNKHEYVASHCLMYANGKIFLLSANYNNDIEKASIFDLYSLILRRQNCSFYTFITNGLVVIEHKKNLPKKIKRPSEHPNSKSIVIAISISKTDILVSMYTIDNNCLVPFEETINHGTFGGEIINFFNREIDPEFEIAFNELWKSGIKPPWFTELDERIFRNNKADV